MDRNDFKEITQDNIDFCKAIISTELKPGSVKNICQLCPFSEKNNAMPGTLSHCPLLLYEEINNPTTSEDIDEKVVQLCEIFLKMLKIGKMKKKGKTPNEFIDKINKSRGYKFKVEIKDEFKDLYIYSKDIVCHNIKYSKNKAYIYPVIDGDVLCRFATNNCVIKEL